MSQRWTVLTATLVFGVACATASTQSIGEPADTGAPAVAEAAVRVSNPNPYEAHIAIYHRSRRFGVGIVEPRTTRALGFRVPDGEFRFILDIGDPGLLPVDAATGRVPCWLTDRQTVMPGDTLSLEIPRGLEGRVGPDLCPRVR
jgi:hypothetical protein